MQHPKIEIDPGAGFCFGVEKVIAEAESLLSGGQPLHGLGEMVHNREEVRRLDAKGLITIDHQALERAGGGTVLFRAHGEPPATYELARSKGWNIIDGTCPIVLKLQQRIRRTFETMDPEREQLVIFGKKTHPETIGLVGQVGGKARVVECEDDVADTDPRKSVHLFSQTTMDPGGYRAVESRMKAHLEGGESSLHSHGGICGQMKSRKPLLEKFLKDHDLILFVSGKNSSNGKMLFEYCAGLHPDVRWISGASDLEVAWFSGKRSVGLSGATSTSRNQLEDIKKQVETLIFSE
ncbi:MAG: 4-hydroxy-3-methylbut-2-enyl diphosphate reductase [Bacteroidales bacterium]